MCKRQIVCAERMPLDRDEVQTLAALRIIAPCLPGGEEIVTQPESCFDDGETGFVAPAAGQAIAAEKDVSSLLQSAAGAVINIVVLR